MGESFDYVPIRTTKRFKDLQSDERFCGWLRMQSSVMEIVFPIEDAPELRAVMFTEAGLAVAEEKVLALYHDPEAAYEAVNLTVFMRFTYYIGETFRRAFEGDWVAVPRADAASGAVHAVDLPFREGFVDPVELAEISLARRSGDEISAVYGYAARDYARWIAAGRPERVFRGTLRESGD